MDLVRLADGSTISVLHFEAQPLEWRSAQRGAMTCPSTDCAGAAWFVGRSQHGRAPHFSGHHVEGCELATSGASEPGSLTERAATIVNAASVVQIDLSGPFPADDHGPHVQDDDDEAEATRRGTRHDQQPGGERDRRQQNLRRLLAQLIADPRYLQDGRQRIAIPERGEPLGTELIREFSEVKQEDVGRHMIVWGAVATINPGGHIAYVNAGRAGHNPFSISISGDSLATLRESDRWTRAIDRALWDTADVHAIGFGRIIERFSHNAGGRPQYGVELDGLRGFAFIVGPDH